jgi:hypothetical protein
MGIDLVSVCVFCASVLLGSALPPPPGLSAEIGGSYSTLQRKYDTPPDAPDFSNVTGKFVLIGARQSWPSANDLGAGTPAREWRVRLALAPGHNDQSQLPEGEPGLTNANGTGRLENFAVLYRHPLDLADSIEIGWVQHKNDSTDGINLGGSRFTLSEQRILGSYREDFGLGWRHRFCGLEMSIAGRYSAIDASNTTALYSGAYKGHLWGGNAEVGWRRGPVTVQAEGVWLTGNPRISEESVAGGFVSQVSHPAMSLKSAGATVVYSWPKTDLLASYVYNANHIPFTSFAVLGIEQTALEAGFHADSRANLSVFGVTARTAIGAGVRVYIAAQLTTGSENVQLTDSAGILPSRTLHVHWGETATPAAAGGQGLGYVVTAGAEFSIGGGPK